MIATRGLGAGESFHSSAGGGKAACEQCCAYSLQAKLASERLELDTALLVLGKLRKKKTMADTSSASTSSTSTISASWQLFIEQQPQCMKVLRQLSNRAWYASEGWASFIGPYHAGIFMQIAKGNWYNHGLDGIHFEFGLTEETLAAKRLTIDLHVGHKNLFDRERFNELTVARMAEVVESWEVEGLRFSRTNLSERLSMPVRFTKSGFGKQVAEALTTMRELAPVIDDGLARLGTP